jgi:hypothetical protein
MRGNIFTLCTNEKGAKMRKTLIFEENPSYDISSEQSIKTKYSKELQDLNDE